MASASRRRGRRQRGWAAVLCFGSRGARGEEASVAGSTPWARRKRTVPVDGEQAARPDDGEEEEDGKGPRAMGCCLLPPARVPGRKDDNMEPGGSKKNHKYVQQQHDEKRKQARPQDDENLQVKTRVAPATTGVADERHPSCTPRDDTTTEDVASARERCTAAGGGGNGRTAGVVGTFGPAAGLSVVAAVSMAGLLGGRLWAVACVCAWLVALSPLRRREVQASAGGDVDEVQVP